MHALNVAISWILTLNLLLGGVVGQGELWLCKDGDGTVSIEDAGKRAACCDERNAHDEQEPSVVDEPCCHDVQIASGQGPTELRSAPLSAALTALTIFFQPVLLLEIPPALPVLCPDWTPLARGAPPLSHLATVILLV
jgi:hypothetical protein